MGTTTARVGSVVLAIGLAIGLGMAIGRRMQIRAAEAIAAAPPNEPRRVLVVQQKSGDSALGATLPGTVRARESTVIQARAPGYLKSMKVDLGDRVRKGQLLAEIEAPELLDQLRLSRARLAEAQANVPLSEARSTRLAALAKTGAATAQEAEDALAHTNSARAALAAAKAEVERLSSVAQYLRVVAPFDGTITRRGVDPGAVVNVGATALFEVATTDAVKVVVDVPQALAASLGAAQTAEVTTKSGGKFTATLLRRADALDELTRTQRIELALEGDASLPPGTWVDVRLQVTRAGAGRLVPAAALAFGAEGPRIFVVDAQSTARPVKVAIVRDFGRELEVTGEIDEGATLILFPPVDLVAGERVTAVARS